MGIPIGTNCAPLVADLFLLCYERDFMIPLSVENQSEIIEAFSSTSRYLDDLLNIDNTYFDGLISQIVAVCVDYIFLFWIAIWPLCVKATARLAFR